MQIGLEQIRSLRLAERKKSRRWKLLTIALLVALMIIYLCMRDRGIHNFSPIFVFRSLWEFFRYEFVRTFISESAGTELLHKMQGVLGSGYASTVNRLVSLLLLLISGAALALSGTVYQTAMRNPMAVPTMLGVSSGVSLAQMLLVIWYAEEAYTMATERYLLSYGISIGVILIILGAGRLVGRGKFNVADLLIVGTIVNRIFQTSMRYLQSQMDTETLELYQDYAQESQDYFNDLSDLGILVIVSVAVMLPFVLMRFSYNMVSFDDDDARAVGIRSGFMRFYGLLGGGILTATAMIHAGNIGMLATVVPLLCRYIYGADFRVLLWTSAAWGGMILIFSNLVRGYTYLFEYQIPLGNIVSLLAVPLLIWIIHSQKTAWSQVEN